MITEKRAEKGSELWNKMIRGKAPSCWLCKEIRYQVLHGVCGAEVRYYCKTEENQIITPDCQLPCNEYNVRIVKDILELKI